MAGDKKDKCPICGGLDNGKDSAVACANCHPEYMDGLHMKQPKKHDDPIGDILYVNFPDASVETLRSVKEAIEYYYDKRQGEE